MIFSPSPMRSNGMSIGGALFAPEYHCVERWPTNTTSAPSCTTSAAVTFSGHTCPLSSRAKPSASLLSSNAKSSEGSNHFSGLITNSGYTVRRGASDLPFASVTVRNLSSAGHGRSGFTWSAVTGETPPQSSMPASSKMLKSSLKFGGACK